MDDPPKKGPATSCLLVVPCMCIRMLYFPGCIRYPRWIVALASAVRLFENGKRWIPGNIPAV